MTKSDKKSKGQIHTIAAQKKALLDTMANEIVDAGYEVAKHENRVAAYTDKVNHYQLLLENAALEQRKSIDNKEKFNQIIIGVKALQSQALLNNSETSKAVDKTTLYFTSLKILINKFSQFAFAMNKLGSSILRKKSSNALISDVLLSDISKAQQKTNEIVSLLLVTIKNASVSYQTHIEAATVAATTKELVIDFYNSVNGKTSTSIPNMIDTACINSNAYASLIQNKLNDAAHQLNEASVQLNNAQTKLKSLKSGLAAGQAAAALK